MKTRLTLVSNNAAVQVPFFRITLRGIEPKIWRVIEVLDDLTFWPACATRGATPASAGDHRRTSAGLPDSSSFSRPWRMRATPSMRSTGRGLAGARIPTLSTRAR